MTSSLLILYLGIGAGVSILVTLMMTHINISDIPEDRSSHALPTPKCGGVAVLSGFFVTLLMLGWVSTFEFVPPLLSILTCTLIIAILGFIDDLIGLSFKGRLLIQTLVGAYIIYAIGPLRELTLPVLGGIELGAFGWILSAFWIVGFTNAFNFMDGINGIATGTTIISALFLSLFFTYFMDLSMCFVSLALVVGCLGFLPFNFPRARIFLGDVGSQPIGFLLASLSLSALNRFSENISLFTILLLFMPFCFDTSFTLIRRALARENVFQAHRSHLYQLLNRLGLTHAQVTLLYLTLAIVGGGMASISLQLPNEKHVYLLLASLLGYSGFAYAILKHARKEQILS